MHTNNFNISLKSGPLSNQDTYSWSETCLYIFGGSTMYTLRQKQAIAQ